MNKLIQGIIERAKANRQRIVLPEATEERTLKAADRALGDNIADIILIGDIKDPSASRTCTCQCICLHRL